MKNKKLIRSESKFLIIEQDFFSVHKVFAFHRSVYLHYYISIIYDITIK